MFAQNLDNIQLKMHQSLQTTSCLKFQREKDKRANYTRTCETGRIQDTTGVRKVFRAPLMLSVPWVSHDVCISSCSVVIGFVFFPSNNLEHVLCSTMFWQKRKQSFFQILLNTQPKRIIWLWVQTVSFLSVTEFQKVGFEIPKPVLSAVR